MSHTSPRLIPTGRPTSPPCIAKSGDKTPLTQKMNYPGGYPMRNIRTPGKHDLLLGRGGEVNNHIGNIYFRRLINEYKGKYKAAPRVDKPKVAAELVLFWRQLAPPGRFLQRSNPGEPDCLWEDIGDFAARRRASKALGERDYKSQGPLPSSPPLQNKSPVEVKPDTKLPAIDPLDGSGATAMHVQDQESATALHPLPAASAVLERAMESSQSQGNESTDPSLYLVGQTMPPVAPQNAQSYSQLQQWPTNAIAPAAAVSPFNEILHQTQLEQQLRQLQASANAHTALVTAAQNPPQLSPGPGGLLINDDFDPKVKLRSIVPTAAALTEHVFSSSSSSDDEQ